MSQVAKEFHFDGPQRDEMLGGAGVWEKAVCVGVGCSTECFVFLVARGFLGLFFDIFFFGVG